MHQILQAWLAFAVAAGGNKMMWQSPGTIWLERPDNIVNAFPLVETLWTFKGRKDRRAAPFFSSFDFFVPSAAERPVHLMHEILLHFDLVLAWGSLDAVASYRLSENNSRCKILYEWTRPILLLQISTIILLFSFVLFCFVCFWHIE